jgi:hypothetical protein
VSALAGLTVCDEKKFVAGLLLWKDRIGADLKAPFDATAMVEPSRNGCRIVNAMMEYEFVINRRQGHTSMKQCLCRQRGNVQHDVDP